MGPAVETQTLMKQFAKRPPKRDPRNSNLLKPPPPPPTTVFKTGSQIVREQVFILQIPPH